MRLLLALSVVLIALAVLPESSSAQEEPSLKDRLKFFGEKIKATAVSVGEETKAAFENLHKSEFATNARKIFTDGIEKIKSKFSK
ncbi:apolipoprotein C-I-like [Dendrobates tinctorius]|uniref:apolipoprotein C-I-like n=1 Tax=Dendrobates tinctorius TaxID=92724 RepID=UPI003CC9396F